jgi:predicted nucleic acid-binding protein
MIISGSGISTQGLALSFISLAELYEGVFYSHDPQQCEARLQAFLRGIELLGVDDETTSTTVLQRRNPLILRRILRTKQRRILTSASRNAMKTDLLWIAACSPVGFCNIVVLERIHSHSE